MVVDLASIGQCHRPLALDQSMVAKRLAPGAPEPVITSSVCGQSAGDFTRLAIGWAIPFECAPEQCLPNAVYDGVSIEDFLNAASAAVRIFLPEIKIRTTQGIHEPLVVTMISGGDQSHIVSCCGV